MKSAKIPEAMGNDRLIAIDELRVGPARIETKRVVTPYLVRIGDREDKSELIYSYEEPVFDPKASSSQNLASMITAQVALNYGLFCRRIVFDGLFDHDDRRFLREMMENTSREIYVNKLLAPNLFLTEKLLEAPFRRQRYTNAELVFENSLFSESSTTWSYWPTDQNRYCVLSSGGKDSLLSYGLLRELDQEAHAVFGNESGRHWFTALNGYRYQRQIDPNTTKVWMNSDRLFNWMLRHLPFIRQDFTTVRADDYPIRLWTVAVFLFGVLPLMKKRGLGRLIIGDEYDTTQKTTSHGITHYNGLFDQSRYFDEVLSRFFVRKGWGIHQFSLLRPLSEMLILKILVERYPELQRHQVSCHATHEENGIIRPCGKCEKCRRIVGMLSVLGADPKACGYTDEQIASALNSLASKPVKQLSSDASHLYYLLYQQKLIPQDGATRKKSRAHPEIMKLRFDRERSPVNVIPSDLRESLFRLMLQHAEGSLRLEKRRWEDFVLPGSSSLRMPSSFELEHHRDSVAPAGNEIAGAGEQYDWGLLTWEEAEERLKETDVALLPVGAIEQHGPHLPLDVDAFDARYLAYKVAQVCSPPRPLVLPLVPYGVSYHHQDFRGTLSISNEAMARFIYDIGMSAARNGIRKLVIINGHGDNAPTLNYAAQMINRDAGIFVCVDTGETSDIDIYRLVETHNDIHAGEVETSTTLAIRPEVVRLEKIRDQTIHFSNRYLDFSSENSVPWYVRTKKISETGTMGDPTKATAAKGRKIWKIMISHLAALVEELKEMTLEEIYQKRY